MGSLLGRGGGGRMELESTGEIELSGEDGEVGVWRLGQQRIEQGRNGTSGIGADGVVGRLVPNQGGV